MGMAAKWKRSECLYFERMYGKKIVHLERTDKDFTHAPKWITDVSNKFTKANGSPISDDEWERRGMGTDGSPGVQ